MALPRFSWFDANDVNREGHDTSSSNTMNGSVTNSITTTNGQCPQSFQLGGKTTDLIELSAADQATSGPSTDRCNNSTGVGGHSEQPSTDSEVEQNDDSSAIENSDVSNVNKMFDKLNCIAHFDHIISPPLAIPGSSAVRFP